MHAATPTCHIHKSVKMTAPVVATTSSLLVAVLRTINPAFGLSFANEKSDKPTPQQISERLANCPFLQAVERHKAWMQRHPDKKPKYGKYQINMDNPGALNFGASGDPEPDPDGEPCGCDYWTALIGGCGLLHARYGT